MSGNFKVLGGTPTSGKSLCLSCANMARRIGQNLEDQIFCSSYAFLTSSPSGDANLVPFRVAECSEYRAFNTQSLKDMNDIAWIIQPRKRGPSGFTEGVKVGEEEKGPIELEIVPPSRRKDDDDNF